MEQNYNGTHEFARTPTATSSPISSERTEFLLFVVVFPEKEFLLMFLRKPTTTSSLACRRTISDNI